MLLPERDRGVLIAQPHVQCRGACADGNRAIAELTGEVEGFSQGLLLREAQCVLLHLRLDARPYLTRRTEEPIGGRCAPKSLMRTLEVVVLDKERHSALAVLEVSEHRAA